MPKAKKTEDLIKKYSYIGTPFSDGTRDIRLGDLWGLLAPDGSERVPCEYDWIFAPASDGSRAAVKKGEEFSIAPDGTITKIELKTEKIVSVKEELVDCKNHKHQYICETIAEPMSTKGKQGKGKQGKGKQGKGKQGKGKQGKGKQGKITKIIFCVYCGNSKQIYPFTMDVPKIDMDLLKSTMDVLISKSTL